MTAVEELKALSDRLFKLTDPSQYGAVAHAKGKVDAEKSKVYAITFGTRQSYGSNRPNESEAKAAELLQTRMLEEYTLIGEQKRDEALADIRIQIEQIRGAIGIAAANAAIESAVYSRTIA